MDKLEQKNLKTKQKNKPSGSNNNFTQTKPVESDENSAKKTTSKRRRRTRKHIRKDETKKVGSTKTLDPEIIVDENSKIDTKPTQTSSSSNNIETSSPTRRRKGRRGGRRRNDNQGKTHRKAPETGDNITKITNGHHLIQSESNMSDSVTGTNFNSIDTPSVAKVDDKPTRTQRKRSNQTQKKDKGGISNDSISNDETNVNSKKSTEIENSYTPNVTVVGEIKSTKQKSEKGGWWNKITGN